jgi:hypothetical protein
LLKQSPRRQLDESRHRSNCKNDNDCRRH